MNPKILLVDDEPGVQFGFSKYLSKEGYVVHTVSSLAEAREAISTQRFDAVLLDLNLPDGNGLDWITDLRNAHPDTAIIVITGFGNIPVAVEAMRRGADNFLTKPVNMSELVIFLRKSLELETLRREQLAQKRLKRKETIYVGESPVMKKVMELASIAAASDSPVILLGETGCGKGILARWIHEHSQRHNAPFVEVNCSSLKGELLASELFGHVRGAFTGAVQDKQGLIEVADGGTLFLDEIADMDLSVQAQFLKVIEEKQYRRLGEVKMRKSDFRLICATNRDIVEETHQGRFRKDLYFRINVLSINIPPLRERREDIPGFVQHLLENLGAPNTEVTQEAMQLLQNYSWPGNIRELRNVLERAVLLAKGGPITPEHLPGLDTAYVLSDYIKEDWTLEKLEEAHIKTVLRKFGGDVQKAAKALGISRATLYRKLQKFRKNSRKKMSL